MPEDLDCVLSFDDQRERTYISSLVSRFIRFRVEDDILANLVRELFQVL
jgi:hypothetical protein